MDTGYLISQYIEYHSNGGIEEKWLERISKEFLSIVEPGDRFAYGVDFYKDIVRIAQYFDEHEDFFKMMKAGINSLEKYGLNLWRFPWRKEYHSVKLYTAFFKCNIEKQLKDKDFILTVLEFLGYTEIDEQKVSLTDSERKNPIWASFNLFLLQVELQLMEEIQSQISSRSIPLVEIVKARLRKRTVEEAIRYLDQRIVYKRRKIDERQGDDVSSHGFIPRTSTDNIKERVRRPDELASGNQTSSSSSSGSSMNLSVLSKVTDSRAVDASNRANKRTANNRHISVAELPNHKVTPGSVDSGRLTDNDLYGVSPEGSKTEHAYNQTSDGSPCDHARKSVTLKEKSSDSQYAAKPPTGRLQFPANAKGGQQHGVDSLYCTFPQVGSSHYHGNPKDEIRDPKKQPALLSNGHSFSCLTGAGPSAHGIDTRYVNLRDTNGCYCQNNASNGLDKSLRTKEGGKHFEGKLPTIQQTSSSCAPRGLTEMERETHVSSAYQLPGNDEPSHGSKTTKASQQRRNTSSEHKRQQTNVEHNPNAEEAANSRQTHRLRSHIESPVTSGNTAVYNINSGATEGRSHLLEKPSSPVQPQTTRNSTQKEDSSARHFPALKVQNPPQGSLEVFQTGTVPVARTASSHEASAAKQSSKVKNSMCDFCAVQATGICRICFKLACGKCKEIYFTDPCKETKGEHQFANLKVLKGKSEQGLEISRGDWSCLRCTFLNPPEKKICDMCATTRGLGAVELSKPGSRVCRSCTCHNDENAKKCHACSRTLDPNCRETAI